MNKSEEKSRASFNAKAADYDSSPSGIFTERFKELLVNTVEIPASGSVLDIACGNGRLLSLLAQKYNFDGYGIDIAEKMIDQARILNPEMTFDVAPAEDVPHPDGTFDVITISAAFSYFVNPREVAFEVLRLLKSGGKIYIAEVYYAALTRMILNPLAPMLKDGEVQFYDPKELTAIFLEAGFTKSSEKIKENIQLLTFVKP